MLIVSVAGCGQITETTRPRTVRNIRHQMPPPSTHNAQPQQPELSQPKPHTNTPVIQDSIQDSQMANEYPIGSKNHAPVMPQEQARNNMTQKILATHETEFSENEKNRANNISRAAQSIHGQIVQPGQSFSYNETVGPTNTRRGYKKSTIFIEGEKKEGVGGGVCQVSTTLFNAAENAGMTILERHDHSLPVTYAESGEEAATSYGGIDFKFRNDKEFSVRIDCTVQDGKVKVTIIGM